MLEGYIIRLSRADSGRSVPFRAVDAFASSLLQQEKDPSAIPVVGVVGPGCSTSSKSVAAISGRSEIAIVNIHLSGTQELNNRILYPYSFGILDSAEAIAKAMVSLIRIKIRHMLSYSMMIQGYIFYICSGRHQSRSS